MATLSWLLWAADDAAVLPSQGVTAAPATSTLTSTSPFCSFAIAIPRMLSYQGKLTDSLGNPVPDGNYQLTFRLYTQETGGSPFWTEEQTISVRNGLFSALLGAVNPIGSVPDAGNLYLSLQVGIAPELTPRLRIVSAAYAFLTERAANSDLLQGRDTTYFAPAVHTHPYVDSAGGAQRVGGLNLSGLDSRYVNEGQANSVTSTMIVDGAIVRADVASNFKAPYSDTADYAKAAPAVDSARVAGNAHKLQNKDTIALSAKFVDEGQANSITSAMIVDGTIATADIASNAITSAKIGNGEVTMPKINQSGATLNQVIKWNGTQWAPANDSFGGPPSGPAGGDLTGTYPNPTIATGAVNSTKIQDGQVANADLAANAVTGDKIQDGTVSSVDIRDTTIVTADIKDGAVTSAKIADGTIVGADLNQMGAGSGQVLKWTGSAWAPRNDSIGQGDNAWVRGTPDSVLFTIHQLGIARGWANNMLYGDYRYTHTNLGVACTTGTSGQNYYYCTVGGGYTNKASGGYAAVGGGSGNTASGSSATVGGGSDNTASATQATISGGSDNIASAYRATVSGGGFNIASGQHTTIGGGFYNTASDTAAAVKGGYFNTAIATYSFVGGGRGDTVKAPYGGILSGYSNLAGDSAIDTAATIAGGYNNAATAKYAFVGGGSDNTASYNYATVGGGYSNTASVSYATVSGGIYNTASNNYATVAGGYADTASGYAATVAGGYINTASGGGATVGGGYYNTASGGGAMVPGGFNNAARGPGSFAAGRYARANHRGSFVWSDSATAASESVYTNGANQFRARARGGTWFFSNGAMTSGVYLAPNANSWTGISFDDGKEKFQEVDHKELLNAISKLRVRYYQIKEQEDGIRHIGPLPKEFYDAFGVGEGENGINMADADGVLFAAVQALYEENKALRQELEALKAQLQKGR